MEVVAYDENRNEIGRDRLVSASNETVISVRTEKETMDVGGDDIVYLDVEITDENGICKPEERVVKVKVQGREHCLRWEAGPTVRKKSISATALPHAMVVWQP